MGFEPAEAGPSVAIEINTILPGPPDVVWELITDWEHQGDWMLEAEDIKVVSPHRTGVGVEAEATVRIGGIRTRDRVLVVGWDPPRRLVIRHLGWVTGTGDIRLVAGADNCTTFVWREELHPPWGVVGRIGIRAFAPLMKRIFRRDARVLEGLVRARMRGVPDGGADGSGTTT